MVAAVAAAAVVAKNVRLFIVTSLEVLRNLDAYIISDPAGLTAFHAADPSNVLKSSLDRDNNPLFCLAVARACRQSGKTISRLNDVVPVKSAYPPRAGGNADILALTLCTKQQIIRSPFPRWRVPLGVGIRCPPLPTGPSKPMSFVGRYC